MKTIADFDRFTFIVGAPRCGTTTIAEWLRQHPAICFPFVKEPHFFAQHDLTGMDREDMVPLVEREFLNRFYAHCDNSRRHGLDGSVSYLYIPERLVPALALWPEAKFLIAVRDPMTMLPSLFHRLRYTGDETLDRFDEAWAAIPARAAGRRIPRTCLEPRWLRYDEAGRLGTYVERCFELLGRERCFVSVFDDLMDDPQGQYRRICAFLDLEPNPHTDFSPQRESRGIRFGSLQRLLKRPPTFARDLLAGAQFRQRQQDFQKLHGRDDDVAEKIFSWRKRLLRWNRVPLEKQPIPLALQQEMRDRLEGDVALLGRLLGRDLSHWLQVRDGRRG